MFTPAVEVIVFLGFIYGVICFFRDFTRKTRDAEIVDEIDYEEEISSEEDDVEEIDDLEDYEEEMNETLVSLQNVCMTQAITMNQLVSHFCGGAPPTNFDDDINEENTNEEIEEKIVCMFDEPRTTIEDCEEPKIRLTYSSGGGYVKLDDIKKKEEEVYR